MFAEVNNNPVLPAPDAVNNLSASKSPDRIREKYRKRKEEAAALKNEIERKLQLLFYQALLEKDQILELDTKLLQNLLMKAAEELPKTVRMSLNRNREKYQIRKGSESLKNEQK